MKKQSQNETDIVVLMTRMQEQLAALDRKVDVLMSRCSPRLVESQPSPKAPSQQPVYAHDPIPGVGRPNDQHKARPMFPATCSDCRKACELPFKPSGDRPVYCKECFSRRKSGNALKVAAEHKPKEMSPVPPMVNVQAPAIKEKKKPVLAKKAVAKKKPAVSKKKKGNR